MTIVNFPEAPTQLQNFRNGNYLYAYESSKPYWVSKSRLVYELDPFYGNVVSLLRFEGDENSTIFEDEKGISWVAEANARIRSNQFYEGQRSLFLDGTGDGLRAENEITMRAGTQDFTVEAWVYPTLSNDNLPLFSITNSGSGTTPGFSFFARHITNGSVLRFFNALNQSLSVDGVTVVPLNQWSHVAASRQSGTIRLFLNGNLEATESCPSNFTDDIYIRIGRQRGPSPSNEYGGNIDLFRYTIGVSRYNSSFTPPIDY